MHLSIVGKRSYSAYLAALGLVVLWLAGSAYGQRIPGVVDPESHSWARFGPRAWKVVRVKTETLNEQGQVERSSIRTTRIQVTRVTRRSCSLCVTSTAEIEGNQIAPEPKILTQTFDQNIISTENLRSETLTIGNREYIVKVVRIVSKNEGVIRTSTVYYSRQAQPQVLKRTTISKDAQSGDIISTTEVAVTEVDRQRTILGESHNTWTVSIVFKQGGATTITTEVHCADVPGELVARTTTKRNADGRVVTRSKLELIGYGSGLLRRAWRYHR